MFDDNHALVILSGGQDSTTCLGVALQKYQSVSAITFDYGQSHSIELDAARAVIDHFERTLDCQIFHGTIKIPDILKSASPLTNGGKDLEQYESHEQMEGVIGNRVEKTFVPMRNMLFLTIAANHAVALGAKHLVTGVCEQDNANYPDCREMFIAATVAAINESLGLSDSEGLHIYTPLINKTKAQSIMMAIETPYTYSALAYSHTAYDGKYPPTGKDHASVLRAYGFEQAGVPDPLVCRAVMEGLMEFPDTLNYKDDALLRVADYLEEVGL